MVESTSIVSGALRSDGPAPAVRSRASSSRLIAADRRWTTSARAATTRPSTGLWWRRKTGRLRRPVARDVVDAVAADQHRPDDRERLRPAVRPVLGQLQPLIYQPAEVDPLRQDRRRKQPGVRHQIALIEGRDDTAEVVRCSHPSDALANWSLLSVASHIIQLRRHLIFLLRRQNAKYVGGCCA